MKDLQIKKLYYSISEVSKMVALEQYVLRYWETEFEQLRPQKNRAGNRIYTDKDIEIIKLIKKLTRDDRFTIEGARQVLGSMLAEKGISQIPDGAVADGDEGLDQRPNGGADPRGDLLKARESLVQVLTKLQAGRK